MMGFTTANFPPVEVETFLDLPLRDRLRALATHWVEYGFGSPRMIHAVYIVKVLLLSIGAGAVLATGTSGLGSVWDVASWWNTPIVYQKLLLWVVLLEAIGLAGSWGPLAGKFRPMTGGILYWARPGTIRLRPWRRVPGTNGDIRTSVDVALYLGLLGSVAAAIALPGVPSASLAAVLPDDRAGLVRPSVLVAAVVFLVLAGLRDKTVFLAARGEQYVPAMVFFAGLGFVDMVIACKLLICVVWIGAGVSKFGPHFSNVIPPMISNGPFIPSKWFKRLQYRSFPTDLRPSKVAGAFAYGGILVEIVVPLILLFSINRTVTLVGVAVIVLFHLFIASTFPLAVPLEWNLLFAFTAVFLFAGFPAGEGFGVADMSSPWLAMVIAAALVALPVLGNARPDLVSFLPAMRPYSGNWASALWAFAPGAEAKLDALPRVSRNQVDQLLALGYEPSIAEITMQQVIAWRSMHSQGRGLVSLLMRHLPDIDRWTIREAEFSCNTVIGFNFGDGHLHNEDLLRAVQARCGFEPGEFIVVWVESQPLHKKIQQYKVIDVAVGVIERGTWKVADAVREQPWLPNGPIPTQVTWSLAGGHGYAMNRPGAATGASA